MAITKILRIIISLLYSFESPTQDMHFQNSYWISQPDTYGCSPYGFKHINRFLQNDKEVLTPMKNNFFGRDINGYLSAKSVKSEIYEESSLFLTSKNLFDNKDKNDFVLPDHSK